MANPENEAFQTVFKVQLEKILTSNSNFADEFRKMLDEAGAMTSYQTKDGAIAVGKGAKAVGKSGMLIEGDVGGDVLGPRATKKVEK